MLKWKMNNKLCKKNSRETAYEWEKCSLLSKDPALIQGPRFLHKQLTSDNKPIAQEHRHVREYIIQSRCNKQKDVNLEYCAYVLEHCEREFFICI